MKRLHQSSELARRHRLVVYLLFILLLSLALQFGLGPALHQAVFG